MFTRPKDKTILSFSGNGLPYSGLGKAVAGIYPGSAMQWDTLAFLPHPTDITDITDIVPPPPPDHSPLFASIRWPGQAGLTSAGSVAAGSDGCLLGRIHFPCGYVVDVLLCCWGVFPVLTLYSPRSIVWGLFFFSSLSSCKCCIFLQFYLHFTTDYTCMIVYVTNNKEPWTLNHLRALCFPASVSSLKVIEYVYLSPAISVLNKVFGKKFLASSFLAPLCTVTIT